MSLKFALLGLVNFFTALALGSDCPPDAISKHVVCYYEGTTPLTSFDLCKCTHVVLTNAVTRSEANAINLTEDAAKHLRTIKEKKEKLSAVFTLSEEGDAIAKVLKSENRSAELVAAVSNLLEESDFDGVEIDFRFRSDDGGSKESLSSFVKSLSKTLSSRRRRTKRDGYHVFENLDDITTAAYTTQTPKNSTTKTQSIHPPQRKDTTRKTREQRHQDPDDQDYLTLDDPQQPPLLLLVRLPLQPEIIAKKYDLKAISRYADILIVPTHDITSTAEDHLTYHPSRLVGLDDILNTDSIIDLLTGLGALKSKMVITLPATALKFHLKDDRQNTPRAPSAAPPQLIDQSQLCRLLTNGNWTLERDDDLTAPYAFSGKTWIAFEDDVSVSIKGKYILLRELAGGAIYPIDADVHCGNKTTTNGHLTSVLRSNFDSLERKPRALVLQTLQDDIHDTPFPSPEAGVTLSDYRIVRVVDHTGAVHVIRRNTKTHFHCSRQGYFSHPLGCNKFYRCVKFDQLSDDFTVFEYDCPAGLAFDDRWEVCVWPGSLPHGAPCTGSSEIAPVPRSHYRCPRQQGYYPDPENCRWFFACLDHALDGVTPLTAYEFRCPFGLVFSEEKLACDWPWLVGSCGGSGGVEGGYGGFGSRLGREGGGGGGAFGALPEYEVSGGRVFNKGGVVLEGSVGGFGVRQEHLVVTPKPFAVRIPSVEINSEFSGVSSTPEGVLLTSPGRETVRQRFSTSQGFSSTPSTHVLSGSSRLVAPAVSAVSLSSTPRTETHSFSGPYVSSTPRTETHSFSGSFVPVSSTPRTETHSFSGPYVSSTPRTETHSFSGSFVPVSSTPRTETHSFSGPFVAVSSTPRTETHGFSGSFSAVSSTPRTETHSFSGPFVSSTPGTETRSFSGPFVAVSSTPKSEIHRFSAPVVSVGVTPNTETHKFSAPVLSISSEPKTQTHIFSPVLSVSSTPKTEIHSFSGSAVSVNSEPQAGTHIFSAPVVSVSSKQKAQTHIFSAPVVSVSSTPKTEIHSFSGSAVSVSSEPRSQTHIFSAPVVSVSSTPKTEIHSFSAPVVPVRSEPQANTHIFSPPVVSVSSTPKAEVHSFSGPAVSVSSEPKSQTHIFSPPVVSVSSTPKTEIHSFSAPVVSVGVTPNTETHKFSAPVVSVGATAEVETNGFEQFGFRQSSVSSGPVPVSTAAQSFGYSGRITTPVPPSLPVVTPKPSAFDFSSPAHPTPFHNPSQSSPFAHSHVTHHQTPGKSTLAVGEETHSIADGLATAGLSFGPTLTPPTASPRPLTASHHSIDQKVSNELYLNSPRPPLPTPTAQLFSKTIGQANVLSSRAPPATPRQDFGFTRTGYSASSSSKALQSSPAVASQSTFSLNDVAGEVTPVAPIAFSGLPTGKPLPGVISVGFDQTDSAGEIHSGANFAAGEVPFGFVQSDVSLPGQQHSFGQRYSFGFSGGNAGSLPVGGQQTPLQPVVSVTPVTLSTPRPFQPVSFQSSPQQQSVTTPSPVVSFSPSTSVTLQPPPHSLNVFSKSRTAQQQPESVRVETSGPILHDVSFVEKSSNVQQEFKSFTPLPVTTSHAAQFAVGSSSDFAKGGAYSPSVADVALSGPTAQQLPTGLQFGSAAEERGPVRGSFEFFGSRSTQGKAQVNAVVPERVTVDGPPVSTGRPFAPQEKLVGVEITKSVELTPSEFFHSGEYSSGRSVQIQQQPLRVISQKTFPPKPVIQPFYSQQESEVGGNHFVLQQQVTARPPPVTSTPFVSTAKPVSTHPTLPPDDLHVLPVFQSSKVPLQKHPAATLGGFLPLAKTPQQHSVPPPKPNLLLPTTTALPDFASPQTNEILIPNSIQEITHTSGHLFLTSNLTAGAPEVKYAINPNIAIPDPPKDYFLNGVTTAAPQLSSRTHSSRRRPSISSTDDSVLDSYSGRFGEVIRKGEVEGSSTARYDVTTTTGRPSSRGRQYHGGIQPNSKYEEYEIEKEGQRSLQGSKAVVVVSQVSDANPILVGKLAGQCSCQSNMLQIRSRGKSKGSGAPKISNEFLPPLQVPTAADSVAAEQDYVSSSTTARPVSTLLSSLGPDGVLSITPKGEGVRKKQFRGRTRYLAPEVGAEYAGEESRRENEVEGGGAAFDRYGPGGWRGFDEVLQGSVDCKRPGLFRHPKHCNKFYACNYDPWKERYTLHVFNCPIQLTYDSSISACNWPVRGPACADDNLLV